MRTNLTSRTIAQNTETQTVDAAGTRVYSYNNYNEVESETLTGGEITHAVSELRDGFGRGTGYTYAEAGSTLQTTGVSYAEATGRIATASFVYAGSTKTFAYNYLAGTNLLESLACPSNLTIMHAYEDKRDLVAGITIRRGTSTNVVLRNYTYDALGRPLTRSTSRNNTTRNDTFGYNSRSKLTSATLGAENYAYAFDNIGNRNTATEAGTQSAYSTNNLNQYDSILRGEATFESLQYDADGNATLVRTSTGTWQITYNAENRPIRFENTETQTVVECGYDSQGRRYFKKVTVAGTVTLHHRYIYRGYLQIACVDCTRSGHPALWLVTWDPSQATATRPLAIQKDGTWFTYGYDITKNVCEVFGPAGYIRTSYSYAPFGNVTESGDVSQPFQWSSEHYDSELALVYYNFRHYSPSLGRFLSRDPIAEQGGLNLYAIIKNSFAGFDVHGLAQGMSISKCDAQIKQAKRDPHVSKLIKKIDDTWTCFVPEIKCACCGGRRRGFYEDRTGWFGLERDKIKICANNVESASMIARTLEHEMLHAVQSCFDKNKNSCRELICDEIEAYYKATYRDKSKIYNIREIVFKGVLASTAKSCGHLREDEKRKIFLEMFDSCANRQR